MGNFLLIAVQVAVLGIMLLFVAAYKLDKE